MITRVRIGVLLASLLMSSLAYADESTVREAAFNSAYELYLSAREDAEVPAEQLKQIAYDAWQAGRDYFGEDNINTATLLTNYLLTLDRNTLKEEKHQKLARQMLAVFRDSYGEDSFELLSPILIAFRSVVGANKSWTSEYIEAADSIIATHLAEQPEDAIGMKVLFLRELSQVTFVGESRWQEVYKISSELLGDTHRLTLTVAFHLGLHAEMNRDYNEAISIMRRIVNLPETDDVKFTQLQVAAHMVLAKIHMIQEDPKMATPHVLAVSRLDHKLGEEPRVRRLFELPPKYPWIGLEHLREGFVQLKFSIDEEGRVQNIEVIEATNSVFIKPATSALERWRYAPKYVDGKFVSVDNKLIQLDFTLEE